VTTVTAIAHPNIALVKYWGKRDIPLNLPAVGSVSLTLSDFHTRTEVTWGADADSVELNDEPAPAKATKRVLAFLDRLGDRPPVKVRSWNNFPAGAGLASSASAFAALTLAATKAAGMELSKTELSVLARQGSGSACRSFWGGFVEWQRGELADGSDSHGLPLLGSNEWDVRMVVGVVSDAEKAVGSTEGMERSRHTSPLYHVWVDQAQADVDAGREAIDKRDWVELGRVMEQSTQKMHATMHTSVPPLMYWAPETVACQRAIWDAREKGWLRAWCTMDAGPQVKVLCHPDDAERVAELMAPYTVRTHILKPGPAAYVIE